MKNDEKISFSASVKAELVRLPEGKSCCMLSEISALTQTSGHLALRGGGRISASYRLDNTGVARRLFQLLKKRLNISPALHFIQSSQLGGRRTCVLTLSEGDTRTLLKALHMLETDEDGNIRLRHMAPRHPMTRQCCRKAFLRGAFLGAGTMTNPEKGYHLEWTAEDAALAGQLEKLLEKSELPFHRYERRGKTVIYLKGAEQISDMLALMGASGGVLKMENTRVNRQIRAQANRAANCDEHNSERMLNAAQRQLEAIRLLSIQRGLSSLPPELETLARLRLDHAEMSLTELGQLLDPPLGKSGVNHRMQRILAMAEALREHLNRASRGLEGEEGI